MQYEGQFGIWWGIKKYYKNKVHGKMTKIPAEVKNN